MKYVTFLNYGCVEICENMLISAQNVGIKMTDFYIGCIDEKSFEYMKKYQNSFLFENQSNTSYENFSTDKNTNFSKIMSYKWKIIKKIYKIHKNLCYVDADIVFLKNPTEYLKNKQLILFQNDEPGNSLCAGFIIFNNTKRCNDLLSDKQLNELIETYMDQDIINFLCDKKYRDCVATIPKEKFPNGYNYFIKNISSDPYIIHNNFIVGMENKINRFKQNNLWFLNLK
jgi:hypothetical protein